MAVEKVLDGENKVALESVLGTVAYLMMRSPMHRYVFVGDWEWLIMPPVLLRQFRVFRDKDNRPVGFVSWAEKETILCMATRV